MIKKKSLYTIVALCPFLMAACNKEDKSSNPTVQSDDSAAPAYGGYGYPDNGYGIDHQSIAFADSPESNGDLEAGVADLTFTDLNGKSVKASELAQGKNLVLVIIRGYSGPICPYCSTQTSRLISNYEKFAKRNAEIVVVYPIEREKDSLHWNQFMVSTREKLADPKIKLPFPVLFDVALKSVNQLGIQKDLSKPATYILNKQGQVQFAYVGSTIADRPSIKAMLDQLDKLSENAEQADQPNAEKKD